MATKSKPGVRPSRPKRKVPKTAWKRGQSGNPTGYTKELAQARREVMAVLQQHGEALAKGLVRLAKKGNVVAIKAALAYLIGQPPESIQVTGAGGEPLTVRYDFSKLSTDELRAFVDLGKRAATAGRTVPSGSGALPS